MKNTMPMAVCRSTPRVHLHFLTNVDWYIIDSTDKEALILIPFQLFVKYHCVLLFFSFLFFWCVSMYVCVSVSFM